GGDAPHRPRCRGEGDGRPPDRLRDGGAVAGRRPHRDDRRRRLRPDPARRRERGGASCRAPGGSRSHAGEGSLMTHLDTTVRQPGLAGALAGKLFRPGPHVTYIIFLVIIAFFVIFA